MLVAIISDIHENLYNLRQALRTIHQRHITHILCLGDFVNPGIVGELCNYATIYDTQIDMIFGDNDDKRAKIIEGLTKAGNQCTISHDVYRSLIIDNKKVFMIHYDDFARSIAKSGDYDAVFCGHNHTLAVEKLPNGCLLANPGELSTHKTGIASLLVRNTQTNDCEQIILEDFKNMHFETIREQVPLE